MISSDGIAERIKNEVDIVDVISEYLPLKKRGKNFVGLCPFHRERTPSFTVSPEKQMFYCFGCGKGGDVYAFLMEHDKLSFREALEVLSRRTGISLPRTRPAGEEKRLPLYKALEWAAGFYHRVLLEDACAGRARLYLEKRGFGRDAQRRFGLGYAPGGNTLLRAAEGKGISVDVLKRVGLVAGDGGRVRDYFYGRILFPIRDVKGRVVGFGGRIVGEGEPKYLNTPETELFSKGRLLFGLFEAKEHIRRRGYALLTEGYTDVMMSHLRGMEHAVAVLGTAVGEGHARLLKRYASRVVMVFDGDDAGARAAERGVRFFLAEGMGVGLAVLPQGEDLCSILSARGEEEVERLVESAVDPVRYVMGRAGETVEGKMRAVDKALDMLSAVPDPARRELMLWELSRACGVSVASLKGRIVRMMKMSSVTGREGNDGERSVEEPLGPEVYAVGAIVAGNLSRDTVRSIVRDIRREDLSSGAAGRLLWKMIAAACREEGKEEVHRWEDVVVPEDDEERNLLLRVGVEERDERFDYEGQLRGAVRAIVRRRLEREMDRLREKMKSAEGEESLRLLSEYKRLMTAVKEECNA